MCCCGGLRQDCIGGVFHAVLADGRRISFLYYTEDICLLIHRIMGLGKQCGTEDETLTKLMFLVRLFIVHFLLALMAKTSKAWNNLYIELTLFLPTPAGTKLNATWHIFLRGSPHVKVVLLVLVFRIFLWRTGERYKYFHHRFIDILSVHSNLSSPIA